MAFICVAFSNAFLSSYFQAIRRKHTHFHRNPHREYEYDYNPDIPQ